ncbi:hypothetical protein J3D56_001122 [Erwinia persicina]|nr:hypothetical protein [Erwinia persicina]
MMHKSYGDTLSPKHKLCNIGELNLLSIRLTSYDHTESLTTAKQSLIVPFRPIGAVTLYPARNKMPQS